MVADIQAHGGILTLDDLKNYTARSSRILNGTYQGYTIYSPFLPSYGAITIQILQILDHLSPSKNEEEWPSIGQLVFAQEVAAPDAEQDSAAYSEHEEQDEEVASSLGELRFSDDS